jgi:hypothetical protein
MLFGVNENHYADMAPQVPKITIERCFNGMSSTWPVMQSNPAMPSLWSPRPNPTELFAGAFDAEFASAISTAPPGSLLTTWHEADKGSLTASEARQVHTYMHNLVVRLGHKVLYGSVSTGGIHTGAFTVPGLDFYGVDIYDIFLDNHPAYHLNIWSGTQPPGPRVIAEINTSVPSHRPYWFSHAYAWLVANSGIAFMTFWNPGGRLSGPWLPNDTATINELNTLSNLAAGG